MTQTPPSSSSASWARFRFSVVGSLLSSPPARGALKTAIHMLAAKKIPLGEPDHWIEVPEGCTP